jgi:hypothetical protein
MNDRAFIFPSQDSVDIKIKTEENDHFKDVLNTIGTLVNGLNNRKQSMGGISNVSLAS